MGQQEPVRVIVEKKGGCFSGCSTALGVLLLIALAIKYWYIALGILALVAVVGVIASSEQKRKAQEAARHRPGPRDPWLNEAAVALGELGFSEVARNTGDQLGGAPLEGDIALQEDRLLVYVNLFANPELARQAATGLRAQPRVRAAVANGQTTLKTTGPVLLVAHGRGGVVDEFGMNEVEHALGEVPLPPALRAAGAAAPTPRSKQSLPSLTHRDPVVNGDPVDQIRQLAGLSDAGVLTAEEFEAKKAELLRRI